MAVWTVKVKAWIPEQEIEFEREVEADSKLEAETAAEEEITDYEIKEKMDFSDVTYNSNAEKD